METIFDYDPTEKELTLISINYPDLGVRVTREEYERDAAKPGAENSLLLDLCRLFNARGEKAKAREYWNKIDPEWETMKYFRMNDLSI
ncbi:hypothetical protein [Hufsiella ginkgonis]|uniref:Tetratricopeptide repeat protein n=1 Tax=Hufsiella ginkgonis TaxID=2695274 RepID=A0A7K1Y0W9_9SPHI|nr:hypothetical protein [Hufsiella ginkgonis]MXV16842.1 hypothetical protein [Hufsiella ginkgonis]